MEQAEKLTALRAEMKKHNIDGFIVPYEDQFMGMYVPEGNKRLRWATGFTGSGGIAAILGSHALIMTDNRYEIQVEQQVDRGAFDIQISADRSKVWEWVVANSQPGARIAYDPRLHAMGDVKALNKFLKIKKMEAVPVAANLVDAVWQGRPALPATKIEAFPDKLAGTTSAEKREQIAKTIRNNGSDAHILTEADSIAWLLNIRARDLEFEPVALSYAIAFEDGHVDWFIDPERIDSDVRTHLGNQVNVYPPGDLEKALIDVAVGAKKKGVSVAIDPSATAWFNDVLAGTGAEVVHVPDPCIMPRAIKTPEEQEAMREAHRRDGVALVRFLKWWQEEAPKGQLTELDVVDKLEQCRRMDSSLRGLSFGTISGWNANGAIVHYRATPETNAAIKPPGMMLLDSGGQYWGPEACSTTDITRTISAGKPTEDMKKHFTLVLRTHIAVAMLRWPEGSSGAQIDGAARQIMWANDMDWKHCTGHGVGCYLSVHENSPYLIPREVRTPGANMVTTNEPGFYRKGHYGIRIESMFLIREDGPMSHMPGQMLAMDVLTLVPMDRNLIDLSMMTDREIEWLNAYHARVEREIGPRLDPDERTWLKGACLPLKKPDASGVAPKTRRRKKGDAPEGP